MAWIQDLSPFDYLGIEGAHSLRAVAWLEREQPFPVGEVPPPVYTRLKELLRDSWEPFAFMGVHDCSLCRFEPEAAGNRNLFVPGEDAIYVCPELITHYINAHGYCPPDVFCDAILRCPNTRTMDYKRQLLASGGRVLLQMRRPGRTEDST